MSVHALRELFKHKGEKNYEVFSMEDFIDRLESEIGLNDSVVSQGRSLISSISHENFGTVQATDIQDAAAIYNKMQMLVNDYGFERVSSSDPQVRAREERVRENQITAATMAAIACADETKYIRALRGITKAKASNEDHVKVVQHQFNGPAGGIQVFENGVGLENYNEKSQRDFRVVTIGYNLAASRQDEFAERIYPTTVINPIEGGVVQVLPYIAVMKDVYHEVSGVKMDNEEVNMVEAYRDPSILDDESIALIPALDPAGSNADFFVDPALVPPYTIKNEQNLTITTAPLKANVRLDLMGNSNANLLIQRGMLEVSDTIDPAGRLKNLFVLLGAKVVKFKVDRLPRAVFQPDLVGDTRNAVIRFDSDDLVVSGDTTFIDGSADGVINDLKTAKLSLRLSVGFGGTISLSKGDSKFGATDTYVDKVLNEDGQVMDNADPAVKAILDQLTDLAVIGFELDTRFTNTNRRQRGHLLQTRALQFRHPIPMHAPVTLPMDTMTDEGPGEVVKALTVNTNIRNSNNAVKRMLNYLAQLREVVHNGYNRPKFGIIEGALSAVMRPTYRYKELDLEKVIDTIKSKDRWDDVCAAILNCVKAELFPAHRDSNIEAAFRVISGNQDETPMYLFCSDKEIANYLMTKGDDRTLGAYLKYDIVSTNNQLFDGKLVVIPTRAVQQENDILSWGQFFYVSTVIADLPITRGGHQVTREIAAIPFNLHVNNIPFALEFKITGFQKVMGETQFNGKLADLKP